MSSIIKPPSTMVKLVLGILAVSAAFIGIHQVGNQNTLQAAEMFEVNPAFESYVEAFTTGNISRNSAIHIVLKHEVDSSLEKLPDPDKLLSFSPKIKGSTVWTDTRTLKFVPDEMLPSGMLYKAKLQLDAFFPIEDDDLKTFAFPFKIIPMYVETDVQGLGYADDAKSDSRLQVKGTIYTSDVAENDKVEDLLNWDYSEKLQVEWQHEPNGKTHEFVLSGVQRKKEEHQLELVIKAHKMGKQEDLEHHITIPPTGVFTLMSTKVVHYPEQKVVLSFSDMLDPKQSTVGLAKLADLDVDVIFDGNALSIVPTTRQTGNLSLMIGEQLRNNRGKLLGETIEKSIAFEQLKPSIRWAEKNNGNIIPSDGIVQIPIEAVGLREIQVEIIRIYEDNMLQFLQVSDLESDGNLRRVASPIHHETISLVGQGVANLNKWNRYTIDLSSMVAQEPGALHQIRVFYDRSNTNYPCQDTVPMPEDEGWIDRNDPYSSWDNYNYYYSIDNYDYSKRNDPCHPMYYRYNANWLKKNILASDIGLIAKKEKTGKLRFTASSITSTAPLANVDITLYNFQQRPMAKGITNEEGMVSLEIAKDAHPYIAVATHQKQKTYLKVNSQNALSLSHFNTSGSEQNSGFKGTIYGERGVWRPGDSLYLTFVLEDKQHVLPKSVPVVMELYNPKGQLHERQVKTTGKNGVYTYHLHTPQEAPTGNWQAKVKMGNETFYKNISIETVKPNRLKINMDFGEEVLSAADSTIRGTLSARWLHGATAGNLKAVVDAVIRPLATKFPDHQAFQFDDLGKSFSDQALNIFEGSLDEEGKVKISKTLDLNQEPSGLLQLHLKTYVFEQSGNMSVDRFTLPYHPYSSYVGLRLPDGDRRRNWLQTDTNHTMQLLAVSPDGKLLNQKRKVKVEIFKLGWRWWWDQSSSNVSQYLSSSSAEKVFTQYATINQGEGSLDFRVDRPHWGRFYVRVTDSVSGHSAGQIAYFEWPWWAGRPAEQMGETVLEFTPDKTEYEAGETAKFNIPSTPEGRALISLENGSRVIDQFWIETERGQSTFSFPVTEEMTPNVYVHATLIQPHNQTQNDLPLRLYGISNLDVVDPKTILEPEIAMQDVLKPEEDFTVQVSETTGQDMTYTIAIVDEGLLDLTRFETPDLWERFYQKEALGVSSFDMYKDVMNAYAGKMERVLGIGGGYANGGGEEGSRVNRFKPTVIFAGPFYAKAGETKSHTFEMPNYVGSVRTMVVASQKGAYGSTEKTTPVRAPLMVLGTLPRVLGPDEEVELPVSIFAMEKWVKNAQVSIKTNGLFSPQGSAQKQISFAKLGEEMAFFNLKVNRKLGKGEVWITATSGKEKATHHIELEVRNPNPVITKVQAAVLEGNAQKTIAFESVGIPGTNNGNIEVSSIPPIDLEKRLNYLIRYPHGCIEQTTSSAFPQLFLSAITDLSAEQKSQIASNIPAAIKRLSSFQTSEGGFAYWPGESQTSKWGTNYAGHFLLQASKQGFAISAGMMEKWREYQAKTASSYYPQQQGNGHHPHLEQAYRLYLLALNQTPEIGAMNRLKAHESLSLPSKWRLAAAYAIIGQKTAAQELIYNLGYTVEPYQELSYTYGSDLRDQAMILETMVELGKETESTLLLKSISDEMNERSWLSTQTTAYCLMAVAQYAKNHGDKHAPIQFSYQFGTNAKREAKTALPMAKVTMKDADITTGLVVLKNLQSQTLFVRVITQGKPLTGDTIDAENDLTMRIQYADMDGNPISIDRLQQGTQFVAQVTLRNPGMRKHYKEMALSQILPSGWEVINTRLDGTSNFYQTSTPRYQDIRDDRVYTYFDLNRGEQKTFTILLTATYSGKYYLPPVYTEAMYDNSINARRAGKWVEVYRNPIP